MFEKFVEPDAVVDVEVCLFLGGILFSVFWLAFGTSAVAAAMANWNCLSLVISHVIGTSRAEHTTSYMSSNQMKTLLSVNHKNIPTLKVYLYPYIQAINLNLRRRCGQTEIVCHFLLLILLAPAEQCIQLLIGAEQQLLLYHTINKNLVFVI